MEDIAKNLLIYQKTRACAGFFLRAPNVLRSDRRKWGPQHSKCNWEHCDSVRLARNGFRRSRGDDFPHIQIN